MASTQRPVYRNISINQIVGYRMPPAAIVSILHRISGAVMFLLLPLAIWLFDNSLTSEISYDTFTSAFVAGIGFVPSVLVKLVVLGLIWAYLHHFCAGIRYLVLDLHMGTDKGSANNSAVVVLVVSLLLTALVAYKLFFGV